MAVAEKDTKERILDTAELLFAERGFGSTSLRKIIAEAGVNLAAGHYHFGSKDELITAVLSRRLGPLNRERIELLDALERSAGTAGPSLEQIVEAFIGPPLRMSQDPSRGGRAFMRLVGQAINQPADSVRQVVVDQFREVSRRFSRALGRACPQLSEAEVFWRMVFMVGSMAHTMAIADQVRELSQGLCDPRNVEALLQRLIPFLVAGLRTPQTLSTAGGEP
jgi:AcrR family transcriptional regulator